MLRFSMLIATASVFVAGPAGSQSGVVQVDAKSIEQLGRSDAARSALKGVVDEAEQTRLRAYANPASGGARVVVRPNGDLSIALDPKLAPGSVEVAQSVVDQAISNPSGLWDRVRELQRDSLGVNYGIKIQTVPPDLIPRKEELPNILLKELHDWQGPIYSEQCKDAQDAFYRQLERPILQRGFFSEAPIDTNTRNAWISWIEAFDQHCLSKVIPGSPDSKSLPLDRIAIILDDELKPICTALHAGGDLFVTARHCFFDIETGSEVQGRQVPKVTLADTSMQAPVDADILADQPFGASPSGSARDLVALRAKGLPDNVRSRTLDVNDYAGATKATEEALLIGYFPIANPSEVLPNGGGQPKAAPWVQALRRTHSDHNYCRVWDRSALDARSGCIEHSCQAMGGFSGAPLFVKRGDRWLVAGLNVEGVSSHSDTKGQKSCGKFRSGQDGALKMVGGVAAIVTRATLANQINLARLGEINR